MLTQGVEADGAVVKEEADVSCPRRHAAEGVSAGGCQRVHAGGQQQDEQRPAEGVLPGPLNEHHRRQLPQEVPASNSSSSRSGTEVRRQNVRVGEFLHSDFSYSLALTKKASEGNSILGLATSKPVKLML